MKNLLLLLMMVILIIACAQVRSGTDIGRHYPGQFMRPSISFECQKYAVEKNLGVEYSKWRTDFSARCYPDQTCKQDFFDCLNSKGFRYQD